MKTRVEIRKFACLVLLVLGDGAACVTSFLTGFIVRNHILMKALHLPLRPLSFSDQLGSGFMALAGAIIVLIFTFEKLYIRRYSFWEETRHLLKGLSLSFIVIAIVVFLRQTFHPFPRTTFLFAWVSSLFLFPLFRLAMKKAFKKSRLWKKNALILGTNPMAQRVAQEIMRNDTLCYEVVGFLFESRQKPQMTHIGGIKIVGGLGQLNRELCRALNVQDIFIALSDCPQNELIRIAKTCEPLAETIKIIPDISILYTLGVELENVGDVIAVSVTRNLAKPWNILAKRAYDVILALLLMLILSPFLLLIAAVIKLDSPGPVIFSQFRLGKKKRIFRIHKFRSMYVNADDRLNTYLQTHPRAHEEWRHFRKLKEQDPRVTRVGKWIRKWSLDELPQFLNVLRGDMSLVGPRPYLPEELDKIGEPYQIISSVTPGMTGIWQIQGRNALSFEGRVFFDDYYIRNWSLWLDIVIILKTIKAIARHEGAY
ncbi:MAG TPA: hypothetical protein DIW61_08890 [Candidatus Aminicenantes bacterium]|nr:hypothetical protein [Candidatus Aminicenantes bacterium]